MRLGDVAQLDAAFFSGWILTAPDLPPRLHSPAGASVGEPMEGERAREVLAQRGAWRQGEAHATVPSRAPAEHPSGDKPGVDT
ncbi:MAG: hypothetical protein ACRYG8_31655 [Janthinobacterium lividum]